MRGYSTFIKQRPLFKTVDGHHSPFLAVKNTLGYLTTIHYQVLGTMANYE